MAIVDCEHARDAASAMMVICAAGRFGGRPSIGSCGVCEARTGEAPVVVDVRGPRLKNPLHAQRSEKAKRICKDCEMFRGMRGSFKVICTASSCQPCGVSLPLGSCPKGKW